jgi:hypothetical protein
MNMQGMLEFQKKVEADLIDYESEELDKYLDEAGEYIDQMSEKGKEIILQRIGEEEFVRLIREVDGIVGGASESPALLMAKMTGELQPYVHTLFLAVLAILIEEEVL